MPSYADQFSTQSKCVYFKAEPNMVVAKFSNVIKHEFRATENLYYSSGIKDPFTQLSQ